MSRQKSRIRLLSATKASGIDQLWQPSICSYRHQNSRPYRHSHLYSCPLPPSSRAADDLDIMANHKDVDATDGAEVDVMMAVSGGPYGKIHQPIHESLTLAALINGDFGVARATTVQNASDHDWEYIRGAVWNDDPDCLLFNDDSEGNNHKYSLGVEWLARYEAGKSEWNDLSSSRLRNPTGRSHYGDLQFLHSMACRSGEPPQETKRKLMLWLEVMYKLANGEDGITADTEIGNTKLSEFFPVLSLPQSFKPLLYLLSKESRFQGKDIGRRAIGSMFHIIQDSYAVGHTERKPLNPEDRESESG